MWLGPMDCHVGAVVGTAVSLLRVRARRLGGRMSPVAAFDSAAANDFAAGAARPFLAGAASNRAAFVWLVRFGKTKFGTVALGTTSVATTSSLREGSRSPR